MSFMIKNENRTKEKLIPFYKVGEIILQSGNTVSTGALARAGFWEIDVLIMSSSGKPIATMINLEEQSYVKTRISQYEAYKNKKGVEIAKQLILGKIEGQRQILKKYKLIPFENMEKIEKIPRIYAENVDKIRNKLNYIEGKYSEYYFKQIFTLLPKYLKIKKRETFRAYDATNNLFNYGYEILKWKIYRALIKARLEPYLGYLHRIQNNRPSLVNDFQEIYRVLIDDFLIKYSQKLTKKDFKKYYEKGFKNKKMPRIYLRHTETNRLTEKLNKYFKTTKIEIQRIRKRGKKQSLQTLINDEASLLAMYLRDEKKNWIPRIIIP